MGLFVDPPLPQRRRSFKTANEHGVAQAPDTAELRPVCHPAANERARSTTTLVVHVRIVSSQSETPAPRVVVSPYALNNREARPTPSTSNARPSITKYSAKATDVVPRQFKQRPQRSGVAEKLICKDVSSIGRVVLERREQRRRPACLLLPPRPRELISRRACRYTHASIGSAWQLSSG